MPVSSKSLILLLAINISLFEVNQIPIAALYFVVSAIFREGIVMTKFTFVALLVLLTASCASQRQVIVDMQGVNRMQYEADLRDCQNYAAQVNDKTAKGALAGGLIGGAIGAVIGNAQTAKKLAGVGAISGGVKGKGAANREKNTVVRRCLRGRGYRVLN